MVIMMTGLLPLECTNLGVSTLLVFLVTFMAVMWFLKKPHNFPPSVPGDWPLIGHSPSKFRLKRDQLFNDWQKEYGNVYHVRVGLTTFVVVSGYTTIKEVLGQDVFSSRMHAALKMATGNGADIFMAPYGRDFQERRKFAVSALRRLGMKVGRGSIQENIQEEVRCLCAKIAEYDGESVDIEADLAVTVANIICTMVFGRRFDYSDPQFRYLRQLMTNFLLSVVRAFAAVPFITYIPLVSSPMADVKANSDKLRQFILEEVERHRLDLDPKNPRDFIDYCLLELDRNGDTGQGLSEDNVVYIIFDLFIAGADTTTGTLLWAFLYMILHPEVQQKVQAEIDGVLDRGTGRPGLEHRDQLPYTVATIMEIQRIRSIASYTFPRKTSLPTRLNGFDILAGTMIILNLMSAHMDPTAWPEPDKFDPDRFLDKDGKVVANPPYYFPFSGGKRNCLGEQLAKMELFLIFSTVLQQFTLKVPDGHAAPSSEGTLHSKSFILVPASYKLCASKR